MTSSYHVMLTSKYPAFITAAKHMIGSAVSQMRQSPLNHGKYRNRPSPATIHHTKLSKENRKSYLHELKNFIQTNNSGGDARDSHSAGTTEKEAKLGRPSSLHEMVDYITAGTTVVNASQRYKIQTKPSANVTVDSVADQFVRLTSKMPGKPLLALDRNASSLHDDDDGTKGNGIVTSVNGGTINGKTPVGRTSFAKTAAIEGLIEKPQSNKIDGARFKLPEVVKQLEKTTSSASMLVGSGDSKESEIEDNSQNEAISENPNEEMLDDDFQVQRFPGLSLLDEDSGCTNSEIIKNFTLRGGIGSGKFKDRGRMEDFRQCIKICCLSKLCDLAFMLRNNCFTVECKSEALCEAVPVRTSAEKPPLLAYIYARSTPMKKRESGENSYGIRWRKQDSVSRLQRLKRNMDKKKRPLSSVLFLL